MNDSYDRWQFFEFERKRIISIIYIIIYIILILIDHRFFNNCHLSSVIPESTRKPHLARYWRKVISRASKLRIRGLEVTARKNWANLCWKTPQLEAENLEPCEKFRTFAVLKVESKGWAEIDATDCSGSKFFTLHSSLFTSTSGMSATRCSWPQRI